MSNRVIAIMLLTVASVTSCSLSRQKESAMVANQSVYFTLIDGKMLPVGNPSPTTFYVKGRMEAGRFIIESQVLGAGQLASTGRPGWLELPSGQFFSQEIMRGVISPYVNGFMTEQGFVPSSREVH